VMIVPRARNEACTGIGTYAGDSLDDLRGNADHRHLDPRIEQAEEVRHGQVGTAQLDIVRIGN
ncbi:MAG TPA: hypothetical protein VKA24_12710, partial [Gaiellaceae bacterium]|nr:hypothetical protein [Gaiellaceae bacterium]